MLLSIRCADNQNKRASALFTKDGKIRVTIWQSQGGMGHEITDQNLYNQLMNLRQMKTPTATAVDPIWAEIAEMDPTKVAVSCSMYEPTSPIDSAFRPGVASEKRVIDTKALVKKWFKFFSEFNFVPQVRFINSIVRMPTAADIRQYSVGYFRLTNNSFTADLEEKVKSEEFNELATMSAEVETDKVVNRRFEVYYGHAGSGKTTAAQMFYPDAELVLCHAQYTPDELFRGFDFEDGKPVFKRCPLREAMEEGRVIILDEINLLNEDCRRELQGILDNKSHVNINGDRIEIKDGFKVVATMNLTVNDMVYPLPAPLVDRAAVIREYEMDSDTVADLAI